MTSHNGAADLLPMDPNRESLRDILRSRFSCRAYREDPVPSQTIEEILTMAQRTPSWCNTQPWHTYVVSDPVIRSLGEELTKAAQLGAHSPDFPPPAQYRGAFAERRRAAGFALYDSLGIERSDRPAREQQMLKNFDFFGAPHAAIVTADEDQGVYGAIDCGAFITNFLNAAHSLGVSAVAQGAVAMHSGCARTALGIPDDRRIICSIAFGYPDQSHPVNQFRTERASLAESVTFVTE